MNTRLSKYRLHSEKYLKSPFDFDIQDFLFKAVHNLSKRNADILLLRKKNAEVC